MASSRPSYGETWVYESIVGALPGVELSEAQAVGIQFAVFELAVVVLAWAYDLWSAVPAGTVAVGVAAVGSVVMLRMGASIRRLDVPDAYRHLLFGSSIEVVLGIFAFVAFLTYLLVVDPRHGTTLLEALFGPRLPPAAIYLVLLVVWDLCYRIGTSWWAAVVGLWGAFRFEFDSGTARALPQLYGQNALFGLLQAGLLPFVGDRPLLVVAIGGHVAAVTAVSAAAFAVVTRK
jgi:hypothetical protein